MKVTVIIPVYNAGKYVEEAVNSALEQKEVKEVVLIEDGSPDNSLEVCRKLEKKYKKVKLFQHPEGGNRGAGETRNVGLRKATQEFVAFLDADDFYLESRFKKTKEVFKKNENIDGVYEAIGVYFENDKNRGDWKKRSGKKLTTITTRVAPGNLFKFLILAGKGHFSLNGLTIRRKSIDKGVGFFEEELKISQDTHFCLKLSLVKKLLPGEINKPVAKRRVHSGNRIMKVDKSKMIRYQNILWKSLKEWSKDKGLNYSDKALIFFMQYYYTKLEKLTEKQSEVVANYYYFPFLIMFSFKDPSKGVLVFLSTSKYLVRRFF
jgi:glycosyltransferase involved in cell wall biosynthesis